MVTDRPQFDVLANLRPAPERQPSEAEVLRAEVAALRQLVSRAILLIDLVDLMDQPWMEEANQWAAEALGKVSP